MTIDRGEVLRYLGHHGQSPGPELDSVVDEAVARCATLARPRHVDRQYTANVDDVAGEIRLPDAPLTLTGVSIRRHLEGAERVIVLAVTIGGEVEREIAAARREGMTMALALDAAATACVEAVCDDVCDEIGRAAERRGLYPGGRFSPGYGDLPLELQPEILRALDAGRRIGLTCTDSLILLPRKSVTAFIGLFDKPVLRAKRGCHTCPLCETCAFRTCSRE